MSFKNLRKYFDGPNSSKDAYEFLEEILDIFENHPECEWTFRLKDVLADWEATAEILLDEQLCREIDDADESIRRGDTVRWIPPVNL